MTIPHLPPEIFKAYDIRGIVGRTLTPEIVRTVGRALGTLAAERGRDTLVIGRDGRLSGPALSAALADGIRATGAHVVDVGMVTTPMSYFAAQHLETQCSVMVTGSHNPPDYNGLIGAYRWFVHDPISFTRAIRWTVEHGHANNFVNEYASVAYWYQTEPHAPFPLLPDREALRPPLPAIYEEARGDGRDVRLQSYEPRHLHALMAFLSWYQAAQPIVKRPVQQPWHPNGPGDERQGAELDYSQQRNRKQRHQDRRQGRPECKDQINDR